MVKKSKNQDDDDLPAKRQRRSRKDPRAPKRSKSAYIFFAIENRESVKSEIGGDARVGDIAKLTSLRWKSLSDVERNHWENVSKADRARYREEKAAYTGPLLIPSDADVRNKRKYGKKRKKDPDAPKRPLTAFLYFSQQLRPTLKERNPGMRIAVLSQELGRMWNEMSVQDRFPYAQYEQEVRQKWKIDKAKYMQDQQEIALANAEAEAITQSRKQAYEEAENKQLRKQEKKILKQQQQQQANPKIREKDEEEQQPRGWQAPPQQRQVQQQQHEQHAFSLHDLYRQQEDPYTGMNHHHYAGASALAGMLSQPDQGMMSMGYPGGGQSAAASYQQAQQQAFYGDAAGRYAWPAPGMALTGHQEMDPSSGLGPAGMGGFGAYGAAMSMGGLGGIPGGMGMYGYGGSGMVIDPSTGYGFLG